MTEAGILAGLDGPKRKRTGILMGGRHRPYIRVKRSGDRTPGTYHEKFWKAV